MKMKKLPDYYITKIDLDEAFEQHEEKHIKYRDEILTRLDGIAKNIEDIREENAAGILHSKRVDERIENHEKRIKKIESTKPLRN